MFTWAWNRQRHFPSEDDFLSDCLVAVFGFLIFADLGLDAFLFGARFGPDFFAFFTADDLLGLEARFGFATGLPLRADLAGRLLDLRAFFGPGDLLLDLFDGCAFKCIFLLSF